MTTLESVVQETKQDVVNAINSYQEGKTSLFDLIEELRNLSLNEEEFNDILRSIYLVMELEG